MNFPVMIRKLHHNDIAPIVDLINRSSKKTKTLYEMNEFLDEPGEEIRENTFVAEYNNRMVGYNALCLVKSPQYINAYSYGVIDPAFRRQGIGSKIMRVSLEHLNNRAQADQVKIIYNQMARSEAENRLAQKFNLNKHTDLLSMKLSLHHFTPQHPVASNLVFLTPIEQNASDWAMIYNDAFSWARNQNSMSAKSASYLLRSSEFSSDFYILCKNPQGESVGIIAAHIEEVGKGVISTLAVSQKFQGSGIGKALLAESLARMQRNGIEEVRLTVDYQNPTVAISLYKKAGFKEQSRIIHYTRELSPTLQKLH